MVSLMPLAPSNDRLCDLKVVFSCVKTIRIAVYNWFVTLVAVFEPHYKSLTALPLSLRFLAYMNIIDYWDAIVTIMHKC